MHSIQAGDDIYKKPQTYSHHISCNTGTQVGQVFLEKHVPSGCFLKDQQQVEWIDTVLYMLEQKETTEIFHKYGQLPQQVEYLQWLQDLQVSTKVYISQYTLMRTNMKRF